MIDGDKGSNILATSTGESEVWIRVCRAGVLSHVVYVKLRNSSGKLEKISEAIYYCYQSQHPF